MTILSPAYNYRHNMSVIYLATIKDRMDYLKNHDNKCDSEDFRVMEECAHIIDTALSELDEVIDSHCEQ